MSSVERDHTFPITDLKSPGWWVEIEREHSDVLHTLDQVRKTVYAHRSHSECPVYCWGVDFTQLITQLDSSVVIHMLYLACAQLEGLDVR